MNIIHSHPYLLLILKAKKINRQIQASSKENQSKILYLGKQPGKNHPLDFIWEIDEKFINSWILHGESMLYIWQVLMSKLPTSILEFGSGLSTLLFARYGHWLYLNHQFKPQIISIEHDSFWAENVKMLLKSYSLEEYIQHVVCPLHMTAIDGFSGESYDINEIQVKKNIDFVMIDGPPKKNGRVLTLPTIKDRLNDSAIILLDDVQRMDEKKCIDEWKKIYRDSINFEGYIPVGTGLGYLENYRLTNINNLV